jgi:hypothetical protein
MRARPISGPLPTTGLENPTPFSFSPPLHFIPLPLQTLPTPPKILKHKNLRRIGPWGNIVKG